MGRLCLHTRRFYTGAVLISNIIFKESLRVVAMWLLYQHNKASEN
ncbi:unnamed protein product [Acanthoscelides obtectus]|uniref:Uncharacterized protein n=1 Tax=Acanthoscelides obtectus TaxID=200917 RepID=A0A9P0QAV8_ACAOB|nr:unnamed protein product [Acanthoscelides obtectus]CAK1640576.1 hypothetical protein AOBTE_LOCUS11812 [Acanthoscelides obtectus]